MQFTVDDEYTDQDIRLRGAMAPHVQRAVDLGIGDTLEVRNTNGYSVELIRMGANLYKLHIVRPDKEMTGTTSKDAALAAFAAVLGIVFSRSKKS